MSEQKKIQLSQQEINQVCYYLNNERNRIHSRASKEPMLYHSLVELDMLIEKIRGQ